MGTSLRDVVAKTVGDAGVNVVYGEKETFDPTETSFSSMGHEDQVHEAGRTAIVGYAEPDADALFVRSGPTKRTHWVRPRPPTPT